MAIPLEVDRGSSLNRTRLDRYFSLAAITGDARQKVVKPARRGQPRVSFEEFTPAAVRSFRFDHDIVRNGGCSYVRLIHPAHCVAGSIVQT